MAAASATFRLASGKAIPSIGLGTWRLARQDCDAVVRAALDSGYKHIDCAAVYDNESSIGPIFQEYFGGPSPKIARDSIFITSKLWNTMHAKEQVGPACDRTLKDLKLDYLDLYLIHWPLAFPTEGGKGPDGVIKTTNVPLRETWQAMEELVRTGRVRHIGVSNCSIHILKDILSYAAIPPAVNQVELHPYLPQNDLLEFCAQNNIHVTAYSSLGSGSNPNLLEDPEVLSISASVGKSPAQVLLRWAINRGTSILPKSNKPSRVKENIDLDFTLSAEATQHLNALGKRNLRLLNPNKFWKIDVFSPQFKL